MSIKHVLSMVLLTATLNGFASGNYHDGPNEDGPNTGNEKVDRRIFLDLANRCPFASGIHWTHAADGTSQASFTSNVGQVTIRYDNKGVFMSSLRYFPEELMPDNTRDQIKRSYRNFHILGVIEFQPTEGMPRSYVKMEDRTTYKTLVIVNDQISVYEEYEKSL